MKKRLHTRGFTLAEILITLVILGFVGALGVPMLGQQKLKKPIEVKARHGTMECFWQGNTLYQFTSNNTENKEGTLEVAADGACYFTAPTANLFVLQAIGAGGDGAVGLSGVPTYSNATMSVSGSIPTNEGFLTVISNKDAVPDWVREEWNNQWTSSNQIKYTLESPIGKGGSAYCEPRRVDWVDGSGYNQCAEYCTTDLAERCPPECLDNLEAPGGDSGKGARYVVKTKLEYSPEGQQDSIAFSTTTGETRLTVGAKSAVIKASKRGKSATASNGVAVDGEDGEDILANEGGYVSISGMDIVSKASTTKNQGGVDCDNVAGDYAKIGKITVNPTSISYSTNSLAIRAKFGVAGSAGGMEMKILEKLPRDAQFKLVPAKSNTGATAEETVSRIYIKDDAGNWVKFMEAGSGSDGWAGTATLAVEDGDLPFPRAYYPESFRPSTPEISIASGASYTSWLAKNGYTPGASGAGAHPIVTHVSGSAIHTINGKTTGGGTLPSLSGAGAICYDGSTSHSGYCGTGNTSGNAGAVVISW